MCYQISQLPDSPHKSFKYVHYQNLIYKAVFNSSCNELKKRLNINRNESISDKLTDSELRACSLASYLIFKDLKEGVEYNETKNKLQEIKLFRRRNERYTKHSKLRN